MADRFEIERVPNSEAEALRRTGDQLFWRLGEAWRVVPSSTEPDELFGEALTENGTILRLKLARAMYEAEVRNKKIGAGWTDEEVLDAYWDQLDAICPILLGVTKGGSQ